MVPRLLLYHMAQTAGRPSVADGPKAICSRSQRSLVVVPGRYSHPVNRDDYWKVRAIRQRRGLEDRAKVSTVVVIYEIDNRGSNQLAGLVDVGIQRSGAVAIHRNGSSNGLLRRDTAQAAVLTSGQVSFRVLSERTHSRNRDCGWENDRSGVGVGPLSRHIRG